MTKSEKDREYAEEAFWNEPSIPIVPAVPELKPQARVLWPEAKELHLIFSKIWRNK